MKSSIIRISGFMVLVMMLLSSCSTLSRIERAYEDFTSIEEYFEDNNIPKHSANNPKLYFSNAQWLSRLKELIEDAESYILFSVFLASYHEVTEDIWKMLAEKQQQGVAVYGIIDSSSNFQTIPGEKIHIPAAMQKLQEYGISVVEYNSYTASKLFILPSLLNREHRKFWVFDGMTVAAGGINKTYSCLWHPSGIGNIDTMVELQSPSAAADIIHSFVLTWNAYSPQWLKTSKFPISDTNNDDIAFWLVDSSPGGQKKMDVMLDAVFFSAQEEIWFVQGYAFSSRSLVHRVSEAVNRGVKVHILFSDHQWDPNRRGAAYYSMLDFIRAGASVYLFKSPEKSFLHYKLMLTDNRISVLGSANLNFRSLYLSREISFVFDDLELGKEIRSNLDELLQSAVPVSEEKARTHRTFRNRLRHLLFQFGG